MKVLRADYYTGFTAKASLPKDDELVVLSSIMPEPDLSGSSEQVPSSAENVLRTVRPELQTLVQRNIQVQLHFSGEDSPPIDVVIEFMGEKNPRAYTKFYRGYENVWWRKYRRNTPTRFRHWFYECKLCNRVLGCFSRLKTHLHIHLEFFPYQCEHCGQRFRCRTVFIRHQWKHAAR